MSKNSKRINATVGVLTTLAMGASMMAGPMAALASGQADQGAEPKVRLRQRAAPQCIPVW